jgi:hypothetical protein
LRRLIPATGASGFSRHSIRAKRADPPPFDNLFRIDFQLGRDADPVERDASRVMERVRRVVGRRCRELNGARVHLPVRTNRPLIVPRTHVVSPFGARGGNGVDQDVDNSSWKPARGYATRRRRGCWRL